MEDKIRDFLRDISLGISVKKAKLLTAEHFGGELSGRYVKIDGIEYDIWKDMRAESIGWEVRTMLWEHGNDFRYAKPY